MAWSPVSTVERIISCWDPRADLIYKLYYIVQTVRVALPALSVNAVQGQIVLRERGCAVGYY